MAGGLMSCTKEWANCEWYYQSNTFHTTSKFLQLGCYDIVLGMNCLDNELSMVTINFEISMCTSIGVSGCVCLWTYIYIVYFAKKNWKEGEVLIDIGFVYIHFIRVSAMRVCWRLYLYCAIQKGNKRELKKCGEYSLELRVDWCGSWFNFHSNPPNICGLKWNQVQPNKSSSIGDKKNNTIHPRPSDPKF
jgi:hypothetical protein